MSSSESLQYQLFTFYWVSYLSLFQLTTYKSFRIFTTSEIFPKIATTPQALIAGRRRARAPVIRWLVCDGAESIGCPNDSISIRLVPLEGATISVSALQPAFQKSGFSVLGRKSAGQGPASFVG